MSELLSQVQTVAIFGLSIIVALYIITIVWVIHDAPKRGVSPVKWGIISLIPFLGALLYSAMRPNILLADKEEQELDYLLRQRELMRYGECGRCSYPVCDDYLVCPNCGSQLKNSCYKCGKPLDPRWSICPWCAAPAPSKSDRAARRGDTASQNSRERRESANGNRNRRTSDRTY